MPEEAAKKDKLERRRRPLTAMNRFDAIIIGTARTSP
jgi:hypothetical protein